MKGKITKGIAGFYYIQTEEHGIYECRAKGIFRKKGIKPLVGDEVEFDVLNQNEKIGNMVKIIPRKNVLIRPAVANIDQAMVIFAMAHPEPSLSLLDRFLVMMEYHQIETIICMNKCDIAVDARMKMFQETYQNCGYNMLFTSVLENQGIDEVRRFLEGKTTALAGPSGVGKSSIINLLQPEADMQTGTLSQKTDRGKHTTRHSELIKINYRTYIMDTPGFSSLYLPKFEQVELKNYFKEFDRYQEQCRFKGCRHIGEPACGIRQALADGEISESRYEHYLELYQELNERRDY